MPSCCELIEMWRARSHARTQADPAERDTIAKDRAQDDWEQSYLADAMAEVMAGIRPSRGVETRLLATEAPLLAACLTVGRAQGIIFSPERALPGPKEDLESIADRLGFAFREVALRGDWYRRDAGSLIGWSIEGTPLALVRHRGHYWRHDTGTEGATPIDAAAAADISARGVMLYRRLQDGATSRHVLVRAAMAEGQGSTLVGAAGAMSLLALALPLTSKILFGVTTADADRNQLATVIAILLAFILGRAAYDAIIALTMLRLESRIEQAVYAGVWDRLLRLPATFFRRYLVGDLYQRSQGPIEISRSGASLPPALLAALGSSLSGMLMILFGGWVGVLCMALLLVFYGLAAAIMLAARDLVRQWRVAEARLASFSIQLIQLMAKLKASGAQRRAFATWAKHFAPLVGTTRRTEQRLAGANLAAGELPFLLTVVAIFAVTRHAGAMDLATFVAFTVAMGQFSTATGSLFAKLETVLTLQRVVARMSPLLTQSPEAGDQRRQCGILAGRVEFNRVCFSYDAASGLVLDEISFVAEPGQTVAIVGSSGAGKSTLLRLLLGFEKPSAGAILLDGHDLAGLDLQQVRGQMGVVLQHSGLTGASIYLNIAAGTPLSVEDAWQAAELAGLSSDIRLMPMGMNTRINENGSLLSEGQCQRLMLARAIARRPRILLLDEATSALDNVTQDIVARNLEMLDMTRIIIAHRLSTVRRADNIIVLEAGRIKERGSYAELINRDGFFVELTRRQIL